MKRFKAWPNRTGRINEPSMCECIRCKQVSEFICCGRLRNAKHRKQQSTPCQHYRHGKKYAAPAIRRNSIQVLSRQTNPVGFSPKQHKKQERGRQNQPFDSNDLRKIKALQNGTKYSQGFRIYLSGIMAELFASPGFYEQAAKIGSDPLPSAEPQYTEEKTAAYRLHTECKSKNRRHDQTQHA